MTQRQAAVSWTGQVDVLIWQARGTAADDSTIPVSRGSLTAILRLGLVHADQAVMADAQEAIEQIRAVLAGGAGDLTAGVDEPGPGSAQNSTRGTK